MPIVGSPSIDHLRIFVTVAEEGSFAAAARKLGRAVSVISYGITNLEAQLGMELFARQATRKPELTAQGKAILAEARAVQLSMAGLEAKASGLLQGLEAEVSLAADVMYPADRLAPILRRFQQQFPTVGLRLQTEALGAVAACVLEGKSQIGITGPVASNIEGLSPQSAGEVLLVPVCAPDHPLGRMAAIAPGEERRHVQLVLTDRSSLTEGVEFSVRSTHTWRLADLGAKHALLREGIGWGNMPMHLIEGDLQAGTLVKLDLPSATGGPFTFAVVRAVDRPFGPAASWLRDQILLAAQDLAGSAGSCWQLTGPLRRSGGAILPDAR